MVDQTLIRRSVRLLACLFLAAVALLMSSPAPALTSRAAGCAPNTHAGSIAASETWCASNSPHTLTADVTVNAGVTVTIDPGVVVLGDYTVQLRVQGRLEVLGTASQPVTLTAVSGEYTYRWLGLFFDGGTGLLRHTIVQYGGTSTTRQANLAAVNVQGGEVRLEDSHIEKAWLDGIYVQNSQVTISNTTFSETNVHGGYPLYVEGADSVLHLSNNSFGTNTNRLVELATAASEGQAAALMGHDADLYPQATPMVYELQGGAAGLTPSWLVPAGRVLRIHAGTTVQGLYSAQLRVQGRLEALGTASQPVTLTASSGGYNEQWRGLFFDGGTGLLRHTIVQYGGTSTTRQANLAAVNVQGGEVRLEDSRIEKAWLDGIYVQNSQVTISNTTFSETNVHGGYPLYVEGADSVLHLSNNSFGINTNRLVELATAASEGQAAALMGHDADLYPQATPVVYELSGGVSEPVSWLVPAGRILRIHAGTTVQGAYWSQLRVQGRLEALGTASQPVTLTAASGGYNYQWQGLFFDGGTGLLRRTTVQYGGTSTARQANLAAVNVQGGEVRLEDSRIEKAWLDGIYVQNSQVTISNTTFSETGTNTGAALYAGALSRVNLDSCQITQNNGHGVELGADDGTVVIVRSTITGNVGDGLRNDGAGSFTAGGSPERANQIYGQVGLGARQLGSAGFIVAYNNWWGDASGPTHASNPSGHGESISDRVLYRPWQGRQFVYLPVLLLRD